MLVAIRYKTKNDVNGNPRRGWMVYSYDERDGGDPLQWIEEEYNGSNYIHKEFPKIPVICEVNVTPKEFKTIKNNV